MPHTIIDWIEENQDWFIELSDQIWEIAELGLFEEQSSEILAEALEIAGFELKRGVAGMPSAFIASYGNDNPIIGILGEYDALPGLSQVTEPVKKPLKEGAPGHGCGHNLFGVACLAACLAIKKEMDEGKIKGTIRFYGTPAEENVSAKGWMIKAGLFDDVDIALTWHPGDVNLIWSINFQAMFNVVFRFHGQSAHAAGDPHNGRSALDAVELMNVAVNYLREHIIPDARIHYVITNGGEAPNIVPDKAEVWYYIRAPRLEQVQQLYPRVVKIAQGAALMTETESEIEFLGGSANMLPNYTLEDLVYEKMLEVGAVPFDDKDQLFAKEIEKSLPENYFDNYLDIQPPDLQSSIKKLRNKDLHDEILPIGGRNFTMGGSTDVGDVSWVTPTVQFSSACCRIGTPFHSWQMVAQVGMSIGHKGMVHAAKVLALTAYDLMLNPELVEKARMEFEMKIKETPYECPLPADQTPPIKYFKKIYRK